ncbi:hypothetical protein SERLA73DRAFT_187231 [Serpula lacrymans var. lacrymans S7.3]|uniref:Phytase A n=2 Tax=Serpula lacrymans var. lacrymans TaxID=341189 RepID=F8Q8Q4_SERL3|nr:uncharacterized protein SERLADRAFT_476655 [Serpula lacrymans var. lacrymans S7.9]EGN94959.1 hypothetical protein SERLA73DRAFT_187231 [Serpula lacrymans var. lacrymans S7.3]EGO20449.1 hypothetical protein SERLADRAFT_476655 [Serpula lacrymans var. lacrymans S7.9]
MTLENSARLDRPTIAPKGVLDDIEKKEYSPYSRRINFKVLIISPFLLYMISLNSKCAKHYPESDVTTSSLNLPREFQQAWGSYSPYFPILRYSPPPHECVVTQVNLLQRHGARYPTKSRAREMKSALEKLSQVEKYNDENFQFLRQYEWTLGVDNLVPFGAAQSFDAGQEHYRRYAHLLARDRLPFVRASSSDRVVVSALNWTAGFTFASHHTYSPTLSVILSESSNNTLDDKMCPSAQHQSAQTDEWQSAFTPSIVNRLNNAAPGANITRGDIIALMSLCAFESVASNKDSLVCSLFSQNDLDAFEYNTDISKYYFTGYGHPLGRVQGVGYVNELIARLTRRPVEDHTQTNSTLDSSPVTFPLDRTFYADFSHDNEMLAIYSALGLFRQTHPLDPLKPDATRTWITFKLVPFSARMIVEKLTCQSMGTKTDYVRILVNDAIQPMMFCGAGDEGMCKLDAFVESQGYARSDGGGDWGKCYS